MCVYIYIYFNIWHLTTMSQSEKRKTIQKTVVKKEMNNNVLNVLKSKTTIVENSINKSAKAVTE